MNPLADYINLTSTKANRFIWLLAAVVTVLFVAAITLGASA
ncbi:hypothetical protein [Rheinheimera salexigens]|nr:hypothetical protein [Rheinheimera salexigens]